MASMTANNQIKKLRGTKCGVCQIGKRLKKIKKDMVKKEGIHPVDPVTIASKSNPILLKDAKKNWLNSITE